MRKDQNLRNSLVCFIDILYFKKIMTVDEKDTQIVRSIFGLVYFTNMIYNLKCFQ